MLEDHAGLAGYELNVSCPNTKHGGIFFSSDPALLGEVVTAVKQVARRPVIVKLSPNVSAIEPLARAAEASGADAVSLVNTFIALAIDARTRRPGSAPASEGFPVRRSSPSRCAWSVRPRARSASRWSGWAGSPAARMPRNS